MMQTVVKWLCILAGCLVLQTTVVPTMSVFGVYPDLILLAFFFLCLRFGVLPGVYAGFLLGLTLDLYSPAVLGQHALAKTVTGAFMGLFNEKMMRTDPVIKGVILIAAFILHDTLYTGASVVKNGAGMIALFPSLFVHTIPRMFYTLLIGIVVQIWILMIQPNLRR
jgi:rod shape-determining protein MreD